MTSRTIYLLVFAIFFIHSPCGADQERTRSFFSEGQAPHDPANLAGSRDAAIQDFLARGILQGVGEFLEPSGIGRSYSALEEKVLAQPDRYVQKFQIFSEKPAGEVYRVQGEVTLSLPVLGKDLENMGLLSGAPPAQVATAPEAPGPAPPPSTETEGEAQVANGQDDVAPKEPGREGVSAPKPLPGESAEEEIQARLLWTVAERWEDDWRLPTQEDESLPVFAATMVQESSDHPWTLVLPPGDSIQTDSRGEVPTAQAVAAARRLGLKALVIGTASLQRASRGSPVLKTSLMLLDVDSEAFKGEVYEESPLGEAYYAEKLIELSALVGRRLDRLMEEGARGQEASQGPPAARPSSPLPSTVSARDTAGSEDFGSLDGSSPDSLRQTPPPKPGQWTLVLSSADFYRHWESLESVLRERFRNLRVASMEIGSPYCRIHLGGLSSSAPSLLQNAPLDDDFVLQVTSSPDDNRVFEVGFAPSTPSSSETASP